VKPFHFPATSRTLYGIVLAVSLSCTFGCQHKLETGYGRSRGPEFDDSVNGTIVFHQMIQSSGRRVQHYRKLTPRWNDYDTIFWIPDDFQPPDDAAIEKARQWLMSDSNKTLVYVARDYDAAIVYWDSLRQGDKTDRIARGYADALSGHIARSRVSSNSDCDWYDWTVGPFRQATRLGGPLADSIDQSAAEIHYASLPTPGDVSDTGTFGDYEVEVLLTADAVPLVYTLTRQEWSGSRIVIVGNGSLIFNLPMANSENRRLAARLLEVVDEVDRDRDNVLFVEHQGPIVLSDIDGNEDNTKWAWITKPPLRYVVPNLVFWCLLFCFVYFPIFGRPRNIARKSTSNFRDHILALAQPIAQTENRDRPNSWLKQYRRNFSRNQNQR